MNPALHGILVFLETWWVELTCGVVIVAVVPLVAGYVVLVERKLMADMQARLGPMRVGPHGLLQPIADAVKLLIKEDIIPAESDKLIFWLAPVISMVAALTSMGAIAFGPAFQVARDINIGILFVLGVSSLGFLGIILGGWASNSHYSIIGALRSTSATRPPAVSRSLAHSFFPARSKSAASCRRNMISRCGSSSSRPWPRSSIWSLPSPRPTVPPSICPKPNPSLSPGT
jgi:NADH-quinone oxidoreductase subunit H